MNKKYAFILVNVENTTFELIEEYEGELFEIERWDDLLWKYKEELEDEEKVIYAAILDPEKKIYETIYTGCFAHWDAYSDFPFELSPIIKDSIYNGEKNVPLDKVIKR